MTEQTLILFDIIILAVLFAVVYALRRMYILEKKLADLELKIDMILEHHKIKRRR